MPTPLALSLFILFIFMVLLAFGTVLEEVNKGRRKNKRDIDSETVRRCLKKNRGNH